MFIDLRNIDVKEKQGLNLQPFGVPDDAPTNKAMQPGPKLTLLITAYCPKSHFCKKCVRKFIGLLKSFVS